MQQKRILNKVFRIISITIICFCVLFQNISADNTIGKNNDGLLMIAAGRTHTLALSKDGSVWGWGDNSRFQLGDFGDCVTSPTLIKGISDIKYISAGWAQSVALKNDGTVWTWGTDDRINIIPGSEYYTIDSTEFIADMSGIFKFRISYDTNVYVDIPVTVLPCETYTLSVESQIDTTEYSYEPGDTFEDILEYIVYRANNTLGQGIQGEVSFVEGQILTPGTYTYEYIFTPDSIHYAPKHGNVTITI